MESEYRIATSNGDLVLNGDNPYGKRIKQCKRSVKLRKI